MNPSSPYDDILGQRLAVDRAVVDVDEPASKLVIFTLGAQCYACHGERVREILAHADVYFLPGCPPTLEGVINVRGDIESVIRPHELLGLPDPEHGQPSAILLAQGAGMRSGLRVDRVIDVVDVPRSHIQPPPATVSDALRPLVLGVLQFDGQPVTLLDLDRLFTDYAQGPAR